MLQRRSSVERVFRKDNSMGWLGDGCLVGACASMPFVGKSCVMVVATLLMVGSVRAGC